MNFIPQKVDYFLLKPTNELRNEFWTKRVLSYLYNPEFNLEYYVLDSKIEIISVIEIIEMIKDSYLLFGVEELSQNLFRKDKIIEIDISNRTINNFIPINTQCKKVDIIYEITTEEEKKRIMKYSTLNKLLDNFKK